MEIFLRKILNLNSFLLFLLFGIFINSGFVFAQEIECPSSEVTIIIRNDDGDYIPKIPFEIYTQVDDVDGNPKPSKKVASGKISETLGRGVVNFKGNGEMYVLKTWHKNKSVGEFYFYNDIYVCGDDIEIEETLSGIHFVLRDTDDELVRNKNFSVYTQRYDADGEPIKEKKDLVSTLNTSEEGEATIYVADSSRSIDGEEGDYYVFETSGPEGGTYRLYDIRVSDGDTEEVEYVFSDMLIDLRDHNNIPFPAKTKIEIFKQEEDEDNENVLGDKVKDIYTDDNGIVIFTHPEGYYVARVLGENKEYIYFWDLEMRDQRRTEYELNTSNDWNSSGGKCDADSSVNIVTRDLYGDYIPGLKYSIYSQGIDVDGSPKEETKIIGGSIDDFGRATAVINPDPQIKYALKIYDKNENVGEFWYFNQMQFSCGEDKNIEKRLPVFQVVLRDGDGTLLKNHKFSLYTQKIDVDGKPIKEKKDLVSSNFVTPEQGSIDIYLSPENYYKKGEEGTYVFSANGTDGAKYDEYGIVIDGSSDLIFEYVFSDIVVELVDAFGQYISDKSVGLFEQSRDLRGNYSLGDKIKEYKTDDNGLVRFEYPSGYYAVVFRDDLGQNNIVWNVGIKNKMRKERTINPNLTRISAVDIEGNHKLKGTSVIVYSLKEDNTGNFVRDAKLKTVKFGENNNVELMLKSDPYLFVIVDKKTEYGKALYTENGKLQEVLIHINQNNEISSGQKFKLTKPVTSSTLAEKLAGKILLQVEENGEAWYVDKKENRRYYMKDGAIAYQMMRKFGLGISNEDLRKIPIGIDERFEEFDYDGDGVFDKMEEAIGTDMYLNDSDDDGFDDGVEVIANYNPAGEGRLPIDMKFAEKLKGQILLQVEQNGEAWYVNPSDGRRYYMKDGDSAYEIMRFLSLGITNDNLDEIEEGYIVVE